jgi:hypothetical protein
MSNECMFGDLTVDDKFIYKDENWQVIPTIKSGKCGCTPVANCKSLDNENKFECLNATMPVQKL